MNIVAIGDVHGCLKTMNELISTIDEDIGTDYQLMFLGDYIDRGPDSFGVIRRVQELQKERNAIALRGNHEEMMIKASGLDAQLWVVNGGDKAMDSMLAAAQDPRQFSYILNECKEWAKTLPFYSVTDRHFFVHAGVDPFELIDDQTIHDMIWIREPFLSHQHRLERYIVHGHTPYKMKDGVLRSNDCHINLDTACVFGEYLSAALFVPEQDKPTKTWHEKCKD